MNSHDRTTVCRGTKDRRNGLFRFSGAMLALLMAGGAGPLLGAEDEKPIEPKVVDLQREVSYAKDVAPVLQKNCVACHNSTVTEGQLNLETPAAMLKGGASGESILAGDPEASFLYLLATRESEPVMPPLPNKMNAHKLTGEEVWKLKRWIELGAPDDSESQKKMVQWTGVPAGLRPIYALTLFPDAEQFAVGRGNRVELFSLTNPGPAITLTDPELDAAHRDFVNALAVHPSGTVVASAGYRCVKIWEQAAWGVEQTVSGPGPVTAHGVSPSGKMFVLATAAGTIQTGSSAAGTGWNSSLPEIRAVAINDDGSRVAVSDGKELRLYSSGVADQFVSATPESPVQSLLLLQNRLLAGHADGVIREWAAAEGTGNLVAAEAVFQKHTVPVMSLQGVADDAGAIVSRDQGGLVVLWDAVARTARLEWTTGGDTVETLLASGGKRLASRHANGRVAVWDDQKKVVREFVNALPTLHGVATAEAELVIAKTLSTDAQTQQKATEKDLTDRKAALEKAEKALKDAQEAQVKTVEPHTQAQALLADINKQITDGGETDELKKKRDDATKSAEEKKKAFDDANLVVTRAQKTLELEQGSVQKSEKQLAEVIARVEQTAETVKQLEQAVAQAKDVQTKSTVNSVGMRFVNPDQLQILTAEGDLHDWQISNGKPLRQRRLAGYDQASGWLLLEGGRIGVYKGSGELTVLNANPTWKLRSRLGPPQGQVDISDSVLIDRVSALAFSPDGTVLATGGGDPSRSGELLLWNWQAGQVVREMPDVHSDVVLSLQFSRDGKQLLSGGADKFVKITNVETGEKIMAFEGHTEHVLGVAWTADGLTVASGSADKSIKIWSTRDGSQLRTISGAGKQVTGLAFIGTTDNVVSSSGDKVVRLHQAGNGRNYRNLSGAENYLYAVVVSPDESIVISGGQDGVVRIWDGQKGQLLQSLVVQQ